MTTAENLGFRWGELDLEQRENPGIRRAGWNMENVDFSYRQYSHRKLSGV